MKDQILHAVGQYAGEVLLTLLVSILGVIAVKLRKLPKRIQAIGARMQVEAMKTPGWQDDIAAKIVMMIGAALESAFSSSKMAVDNNGNPVVRGK